MKDLICLSPPDRFQVNRLVGWRELLGRDGSGQVADTIPELWSSADGTSVLVLMGREVYQGIRLQLRMAASCFRAWIANTINGAACASLSAVVVSPAFRRE